MNLNVQVMDLNYT